MNASLPWLVGLMATLALTDCSGDDSKSSGGAVAQQVDACKIVTQRDATALFGQTAVSDA
jgi:hypothetical protein